MLTDGDYSKQKFLGGVRALGLHPIGQLRADANLRYLYSGLRRSGAGRPQQYDGKVAWRDLSRFDRVETDEEGLILYCQTVNHVQCKRHVRVVKVVETRSNRSALLFRTDVELPAATISRYDKARFQGAWLFREAQQFTGLNVCQARSQAKLHVHCNASLTAVSVAELIARQETKDQASTFSMASLKRRAFNQHLLDRILATLAEGMTLEKCSPVAQRHRTPPLAPARSPSLAVRRAAAAQATMGQGEASPAGMSIILSL